MFTEQGSNSVPTTSKATTSTERRVQHSKDGHPSLMSVVLSKNLQQSSGHDEASNSAAASIPKRDGGGDDESAASQSDGLGPCPICLVNKKDGLFNHGKTSHAYCCYKCSKKTWLTNRYRCPICNQKVNRVSKLFCQ